MYKNLKNEYPKMPHSFHDSVEKALLKTTVQQNKKNPNFGRIILIAAALVAILSLSVFAGNQVFDWFDIDDSKLTLNIEDESITPAGYVKLDFGYMPEYIEATDDYQKYRVKGETGGLTFILYKNETGSDLKIDYVGEVTEYMFGENEGVIVDIDDSRVYDRQMIIRFNDMGYILYCFVHEAVNNDDLIKIANELTLVETDSANAFVPDSNIPWLEND